MNIPVQIIPNSQDTKKLLAALRKKFKDMGCTVSNESISRMALDSKLVYSELVMYATNEHIVAAYNTDLGDYALENIDKVNIHITFELH